jgi:hypothetical protein
MVLGRTLGRALAHEIGHYILRSRGHSLTGLMRARRPVTDFMEAGRSRFGISGDEVARMQTVMHVAATTLVAEVAPQRPLSPANRTGARGKF